MKTNSRVPQKVQIHRLELDGESFLTSVSREKDTAPSPLHYHTGCEMLLLEKGEMTLFTGDRRYRLTTGDICIIGENMYHYLEEETPSSRTSVQFSRHVSRGKQPLLQGTVVFRDEDLFSLAELFFHQSAGSAAGEHMLTAIVAMAVSRCAPVRNKGFSGSLDDVRDVIIDDYFSDRYDEDLSPRELASLLAVGTRQLGRILQELYGRSFGEKLCDMRMEAAKDMLKNTSLPLSEISQAVGFRQTSNFYRSFRMREGCTPGEYRRAHAGISDESGH